MEDRLRERDRDVYVRCIPLFSNNIHHMHLSMTVIFHYYIRVNVVVQSLIIDHMHPFVYWKKNIEKENMYSRICFGKNLNELASWSMFSKLLQIIFHNI